MIAWPAAPHVAWARTRPAPRYDLAASDLLPVTAAEWPAMVDPRPETAVDPATLDAALSAAIAVHHGVPADHVVTTVGASGANFLALASLVRPGDGVIVEEPGYAPHAAAARLFGAEVIAVPRPFARDYAVDPEAIAAAITPRTRLVVLTRPHNPTGAVIDGPTLEAIADVAERARVHVLVEEVYLDTLGGASVSPAALVSERFISTSSLTKAYGLADIRCGWALAAPGVAARMRAARAVVAPVPSPSQRLALRAFADLALLADRARRIVVTNRARVQRTFAGRDDVAWVPPAGGTVAFPKLLRVADVDGFVDRLLVEHHTAVVPGRFFGHPQHMRVAFGMGAEELARGLDAVAAALDAAAHLETARR
jgi:aspartate/methionine/tyrosine aminotransferase